MAFEFPIAPLSGTYHRIEQAASKQRLEPDPHLGIGEKAARLAGASYMCLLRPVVNHLNIQSLPQRVL
jgi:hypothetical protein